MFCFNIVNSSVQNRKILVGQNEIRKVTKSLISIMYQTIYIHSIILVLKTDTLNFPQKFQVFFCFFFFFWLFAFISWRFIFLFTRIMYIGESTFGFWGWRCCGNSHWLKWVYKSLHIMVLCRRFINFFESW